MPAGWTTEELVTEAVVVPRRAYIALPDLELIEWPGWLQIMTPSYQQGGFNEVLFAALDDAEADAVIDRTIAGYRDRGIRFRWTVGPDSRPTDLGERLMRRGLTRHVSHAMVRDTSPPATSLDPEVTVEAVDRSNVETYTRVMATGWGIDPAPLRAAHELMLREYPTRPLMLARVGAEPAATAGQVMFARSSYLIGAVVLPAFRRRGVYAALVAARIEAARAAGIGLATSIARADTSAPLLARLGFERVRELQSFTG